MEGELEVEVGGGGGVEGDAVTTRVATGGMAKTSSGGWLGVAGVCGVREGGGVGGRCGRRMRRQEDVVSGGSGGELFMRIERVNVRAGLRGGREREVGDGG